MQQVLNTIYLLSDGYYINLDHKTLKINNKEKSFSIPLHHLNGIIIFGNSCMSAPAMSEFVSDGKQVIFLSSFGKFKSRVEGPKSGNILLRKSQFEMLNDIEKSLRLAKFIVDGKIKNSRFMLLKSSRDSEGECGDALGAAAELLLHDIRDLKGTNNLNEVRGVEGHAAKTYFGNFSNMIKYQNNAFNMENRNRRPPRDPINSILSFVYSLLLCDCVSALESVGLDPQAGVLHSLRPGRPSLALDLMEEFRSIFVDRFCISLINKKQINEDGFINCLGGSVIINDETKKIIISKYQKKKQEEIFHQELGINMRFGLIPLVQAKLLAKYIRGESGCYKPFSQR